MVLSAVSERICHMNLKMDGEHYCVMSAYFPDSTYGDARVEVVYDTLNQIVHDPRQKKQHIILGGDFNGQVGRNPAARYFSAVGCFGVRARNS